MRRRWRAVSLLAALVGTAILARVGWYIAQERFARWIDQEHGSGGMRWRVFGVRSTGWRLLEADSLKFWNRTTSMRLRTIAIRLRRSDVAYALPLSVDVRAGRLDIALLPDTAESTAPPGFPASLKLPAELSARLDTLDIRSGRIGAPARILATATGIEASSLSPFSARFSVEHLEPRDLALGAAAWGRADWTESDTLRLDLSAKVTTGCCEQDTIAASAALGKGDLRAGSIHAIAEIEGTRGWSDVVPALAKAPAAREIRLEAWCRTGTRIPSTRLELGFSSDSIAFLPGMRFQLRGALDSSRATLDLEALEDGERRLMAALSSELPRDGRLQNASAAGEIRIDGLGWLLRGFEHPLDGTIHVDRIDRKGANFGYSTDAGTEFVGEVAWKGLHWNLDARIAPTEPWAVGWVPGLSMLAPGSAHGNDSAGGAVFHVTARQPRMKIVALDSLSTTLWIGPGPHLVFSGIEAKDSVNTWLGDGDIAVRDSVVRFSLRPESDSVGIARLEARFDGRVKITTESFPNAGLPLQLPIAMPFHAVVDGSLVRDPLGGDSSSRVVASLRARPARDSLRADIELAIHSSSIQLPRLSLEVGGSRLEGSIAASEGPERWELDTLRFWTPLFELPKAQGLWPGIPELEGKLTGGLRSIRGEGVSASARLDYPAILGKDRKIPLPDLLLWGERDTLNLGGWAPIAGSKSPFHLVATDLWEATPRFRLKTFWGDLVRLDLEGSFEDKKRLHTSWRLDGSTQIPGTDIRLEDILVSGAFAGRVEPDGFRWNAAADGTRGSLKVPGLERNRLDLRFKASADPKAARLDMFSLSGPRNGSIEGSGSYQLATKALSASGHAHRFRLDLGSDKRLELDSLGFWATPDSRIRISALGASWHQEFGNPSEKLDIGVSRANLVLVQAKDWKKLSGTIGVQKLEFTKNFAQPIDLFRSTADIFRRRRRQSTGSSASSPMLLDIQATSESDDIRISNNLGTARLGFDLQATGPSDAPLLNGFAEADPDSGRFGYLGRNFSLDTLRLDWNTAPLLKGSFSLSGSHAVRNTCAESDKPTAATDSSDYCHILLSSRGTLENPRLAGLTTQDCATDPGDDGTVGAFVAVATGCYPKADENKGTKWGEVVREGTFDIAYGLGMGWFNRTLMDRLRNSRDDAEWLPDSVILTDVPVPGQRDQLGLLALYHLTPDLDGIGVYRHTFTQSGSTTDGSTVLADDYGVSLKYRIPFWWVEEEKVRERLVNRVSLQLDFKQALDENSRRSTTYQPSLRYRWEFW